MSPQDVSFGVFGLGNRQYEHFAVVGRKVHSSMLALDATAVVARGDGDDDADIDEDFDEWRALLIKALKGSPLLAAKVYRKHSFLLLPVASKLSVPSQEVFSKSRLPQKVVAHRESVRKVSNKCAINATLNTTVSAFSVALLLYIHQ